MGIQAVSQETGRSLSDRQSIEGLARLIGSGAAQYRCLPHSQLGVQIWVSPVGLQGTPNPSASYHPVLRPKVKPC